MKKWLAMAAGWAIALGAYAAPPTRVVTLGGTVTSADSVMLPGAYDQREHARFFGADGSGRDLGERADVVSFRTAPLHEAVAKVTSTPADILGFADRGRIAPGLRADLLRVRLVDGQPVIRGIWVNGNRAV